MDIHDKIAKLESQRFALLAQQEKDIRHVKKHYEKERQALGKKLGTLKRQQTQIENYQLLLRCANKIIQEEWGYEHYKTEDVHIWQLETETGALMIECYFEIHNKNKIAIMEIKAGSREDYVLHEVRLQYYTLFEHHSKEEGLDFIEEFFEEEIQKCQSYLARKGINS